MRKGVSLTIGLMLLFTAPVSLAADVSAAPVADKAIVSESAPVAAPDPPTSGIDHLGHLDNISQNMENMIAGQAFQINILTYTLAFIGLVVTLGSVGIFIYARKKIKQAVTSRALDFMKLELSRANAHTNNLNCILNTTLLNVARDLAYTSKVRMGDCIASRTLDLSKRADVDTFLE